MSDQANRLRQMILARGSSLRSGADDAPCMIAVAGGKGGVGTTTIAVNLAIALAQDGQRTMLVDVNAQRGDVAAHCGLVEGYCLADVLAGRHTLHEAIQLGPAGIQVLAGRWGEKSMTDWSSRAQEWLLRELSALGPHVDCILLDLGARVDATAQLFWRAADEVVVVTSPDSVAVMDTYAAIKALFDPVHPARIATLVNQATQPGDVHERLQQACQRFLGIEIRSLGEVSYDPSIREAGAIGRPALLHAPQSAAPRELAVLAERLRGVIRRKQETTERATGRTNTVSCGAHD